MGKRISQAKRQRQRLKDFRDYDLYGRELVILAVGSICVDSKRFQYKIIKAGKSSLDGITPIGQDGSVGSLDGIAAWNFAAEGVLDVWRDPADNRCYVVNGHNRLAKARELGIKNLPCKLLPAATDKDARELGAIANIAAGCGTALDAARFFRDGRWDKQRCKRYGIRLSQSVASNGLAIAKLCQELFDQALSGRLSEKRAAIIGHSGLNESQQLAIVDAIRDREALGHSVNDDQIRELVSLAKIAADHTMPQDADQFTLFESDHVQQSLIFETAMVQAEIRALLASSKRIYRTAVKGATTLESSGVATVNADLGANLADRAQSALGIFDREKLLAGPISQAIKCAAVAIAEGHDKAPTVATAYNTVIGLLG